MTDEVKFCRQFRFLLGGDHLSEQFTAYAEVDEGNRTVTFGQYEAIVDGKVPVIDWVEAVRNGKYPEETITLKSLDENGDHIYAQTFSALWIEGSSASYDYSKSDPVIRRVVVGYRAISSTAARG